MIGEILGGVSAIASLLGSLGSAGANRRIDTQLAKQRSDLQTWYDREYNQNYLDTEEARSTIQILRDQAKEQMKKIDQSNAIKGASDEARVATADKLNRSVGQNVTQLAGLGTRKKESANRMFQILNQNQNALELQNLQNKSQNWSNFSNNAMNAGIGFAQAGGEGAFSSLEDLWKKRRLGKKAAGIVAPLWGLGGL
jgi:hypothetical protein